MAVFIDKERGCFGLCHALRHGHGLGCGRCLVQERRVRNFEARQITDHGLVVQQRLKATLRNFRLIGRVSRIPRRVFQDVALNGGRRHGAVEPLPDQRGHLFVFLGHVAEEIQQFTFRLGLPKIERFGLTDGCRDRLFDQLIEALNTHNTQHFFHLSRAWPDVTAVGKIVRSVVGGFKRHGPILGQKRSDWGRRPPPFLSSSTECHEGLTT